MSLYALGEARFDVKRQTAAVVDAGTAAALMTVARQPARRSLLQVSVTAGTSCTGSVTITGTVDGQVGEVESLAFEESGQRTTRREFTAIATVATAGLTNESTVPTVEVRTVGIDGSPQHQTYTVAADRAGNLWQPFRPGWPQPVSGSAQVGNARIALPYEEVWSPREGDVFVDLITSEEWLVVARPRVRGGLRPSHWELDVERRDGTV